MVAVVANGAGRVGWQLEGVVEQDQRMRGPAAMTGQRWLARPDEPADTTALPQPPQEIGVGLVVLHGEFTRRTALGQQGPVHIEARCQHRIDAAPLREQHLGDIQLAGMQEYPGIGALAHQC